MAKKQIQIYLAIYNLNVNKFLLGKCIHKNRNLSLFQNLVTLSSASLVHMVLELSSIYQ